MIKFSHLVVFLFLFLFVFSCISTNDEDPEASGDGEISMVLYEREFRPLQIGTLMMSGMTLSSSEYEGTIGGMDATFYLANESTLAFIIPENIEEGAQTLALEIGNTVYNNSITILAGEEVDDAQTVFSDYYNELTSNSLYEGIDTDALDEAMTEFQSLSEEDQLIAAQMLLNNKKAFDELAEALNELQTTGGLTSRIQECDILCKAGLLTTVVSAALSAPAVAAIGAGVLVGLAAQTVYDMLTPVMKPLINKVIDGLEAAYGLGYNRMAYLTELVYDKANQEIVSQMRVADLPDEIELEKDEVLTLSIQLVKTPLISEANRDEYPDVDQLLDLIYSLQDKLGAYFDIPDVPTEDIGEYAESLGDFSYSISNDKVTTSGLNGDAEEATISFSTEELTDQEFDFTLSYTNEERETSSFTQKFVLKASVYTVVRMSGSALPSTLALVSGSLLGLKLVDAEGEDMEYFDATQISISNISNSEVSFHTQSDDSGNYFEIVAFSDVEVDEFSFDLYYGDLLIQTITASVTLEPSLLGEWDGSSWQWNEVGASAKSMGEYVYDDYVSECDIYQTVLTVDNFDLSVTESTISFEMQETLIGVIKSTYNSDNEMICDETEFDTVTIPASFSTSAENFEQEDDNTWKWTGNSSATNGIYQDDDYPLTFIITLVDSETVSMMMQYQEDDGTTVTFLSFTCGREE